MGPSSANLFRLPKTAVNPAHRAGGCFWEACRQAQTWVDLGLPHVVMAVNISAMEFRDDCFLDNVFAILKKTGFDPGGLRPVGTDRKLLMKRADTAAAVLQKS